MAESTDSRTINPGRSVNLAYFSELRSESMKILVSELRQAETPHRLHGRSPRMRYAPPNLHNTTDMYEVEVSLEGDGNLQHRKKKCSKHPGHIDFIPVLEFGKQHLPEKYRNDLIVDLIQYLSSLTVCLKVCKISSKRPAPPYPPPNRQETMNQGCAISGSGHVSAAFKYTEEDQNKCQCQECLSSGTPKTCFGKIFILTAAHVVHDDIEAENTSCYFFFDDEDDDIEEVKKISGLKRVEICLNEDRCWMFGYTHDMSLVQKLHHLVEEYENLVKKVREKYYVEWFNAEETAHKLTVIVSHPHGCCKNVSIGEFKERNILTDDPDWTQYAYTTPTCPGSSGAPVFILGKNGGFDYHHHSGSNFITGLNQSTYGLF
uniref:Peptidase S1 domain-containing protein n=1 Tax=Arion vulgaris TaxID=1028688 RepID=A0A0B7AM22_9EUPU